MAQDAVAPCDEALARAWPDESPRIDGYRVANSVVVRTGELDRVGEVVDAAIAAGANEVQALQFGLRDDGPVRLRALAEATRRARATADVVAEALGREVARVVSVDEGGAASPFPGKTMRFAEASTPIEVGDVDVHASVVLEAELRE